MTERLYSSLLIGDKFIWQGYTCRKHENYARVLDYGPYGVNIQVPDHAVVQLVE